MSCILRAGGENFDVEKFMGQCSLEPDSTWKKGEPRFPNSANNCKLNESSGIRFVVSEADFSKLSQQIEDAISFFTQHKADIEKLTAFPGVESAVIDFGAEIHPPGWSSFTFPPKLMSLAGAASVSLCVSVYPVDENEDENA